jgi:hypothetical protein
LASAASWVAASTLWVILLKAIIGLVRLVRWWRASARARRRPWGRRVGARVSASQLTLSGEAGPIGTALRWGLSFRLPLGVLMPATCAATRVASSAPAGTLDHPAQRGK